MRLKMPELPPPQIIAALRGYNLLPAIVFQSTRRRCDEAASETALVMRHQFNDPERQEARRDFIEKFQEEYPEIRGHKHRGVVIRGGIAAHHAGHIPAWKLLVEKMMVAGLLDAIFATSTVAAGVDFPARTVVISQADTRGNDGWRPLRASELQQMTGRAGRRGKDQVGFIVLAPSTYQNPARIANLLKAQPDPLQSQFRATYSSLLNLLDAYGSFAQVREIAERSFAFRDTAKQIIRLEKAGRQREDFVTERLRASGFNIGISELRTLERLASVRARLQERLPETRHETRHRWLVENVQAGRIVTQGRGGHRFFLVLQKHGDKVVAMRDDGQGQSFNLARVNRIYAKKYPLHEDSIDLALDELDAGQNPQLDEPRTPRRSDDEQESVEIIENLMAQIPAPHLTKPEQNALLQTLWEHVDDADFLNKNERDIEYLRNEIWQPFERRARVLDHFGYLDYTNEKVTERGKWLADVRVDRPLLVGELLEKGLFATLDPSQTAGLMAAIAADSDRSYGEITLDDYILTILSEFEAIAYDVSAQEFRFGVEPTPEINFTAAATAAFWAQDDVEWEDLVRESRAEEGDLVRLLSRTGEALLQVAGLKKSQPQAAALANQTAEIILREPIR